MTTVIVSGSLPDLHCGIGDYTARVASELASRGGESIVVVTSRDSRIRDDAAQPARVVRAPGWRVRNLPGLMRIIRAQSPALVHIQYPAVGYGRGLGIVLLPLAVRVLGRIPVVLTIHERRERSWPARLAINFMALSSNVVVALDPVEAAGVKSALWRFSPPVLTGEMISTIAVAPGVDRQAWRRRWGAGEGDLVVVTFGLAHPRRRIEDIIDAVAELRRSVAVRLWVVGGEAEYDRAAAEAYVRFLQERAGSLGLSDLVRWTGHVEPASVSAALQAADVAVLLYPDGASGRNTTLRAALDHGLPVVTTSGRATSPAIRADRRLVLLPFGEYAPADLAAAILRARDLRPAAGREASDPGNLRDHVDFHLEAYRRLNRALGAGPGVDAAMKSGRT
jgi:glycosyltransferase involved in cell wall biosynthesis